MPDYEALAKKHGGSASTGDLDAIAKKHGGQSGTSQPTPAAAPVEQPQRTWGDAAVDFLGAAWGKVNPIEQVKGIAQAAAHPWDAFVGMNTAQGELAIKARDAFQRGDHLEGVRHSINYLIPLLGPESDAAGDKLVQGKTAEGLGDTVGMGVNLVTPAAISKLKSVRVPGPLRVTDNAKEAAALGYLESKGVPVSGGVKTGSPYVRGVEKVADSSMLGSRVAERAKTQTTAALRDEADDLISRAHPHPVTPEQAGTGSRRVLEGKVSKLDLEADDTYSDFRTIEADPKNVRSVQVGTKTQSTGVLDANGQPVMRTVPITKDIPLPVDMRSIKKSLEPVYKEMQTWMEPARRNSSAGFQALKSILEGEDFIQASIAEKGLGGLKTLSREADSAATRNTSQGLAANAVKQLQEAIDTAVAQAPERAGEALGSLRQGRRLTSLKYGVNDIVKQLRDEPVQTFGQMTYAKDAGIGLLRKVAKEAPAELPKIGRAYLEELFGKATREGGFGREAGVWQQWQNLGPQTKKLLFKNPMHIEDLDKFFLGAKKLAENPNPSGSGVLVAIGAEGTLFLNNPMAGAVYTLGAGAVSKLLHSPKGVRALTEGMRIPLGNKAAAALAAAQILKMAGEDVQRMEQQRAY